MLCMCVAFISLPACAARGAHGGTGAVNKQHQRRGRRGEQRLPLAATRGYCTAHEAFAREKSQQNGGAHKSHVTSLCFRPRPEPNLTDTTRFTNKTPNQGDFTATSAVECYRNIRSSSRSVVCANEQAWRPFCTSLRRQLSSATR